MVTSAPHGRPGVIARAVLTGVLICCDVILAFLLIGWATREKDRMSALDEAAFHLVGWSAAGGVVIGLLALIVTVSALRDGSAGGLAATAVLLGWLRLFGVVAAAIWLGVIASDNFFLGVLAIIDASATLIVADTARRLAQDPRRPARNR